MPLFSHYGEDIPDISSKLSYPSLVFAIVTPLVVLARFLSRMVSGRVGADDWVILVSCVYPSLSLSLSLGFLWGRCFIL